MDFDSITFWACISEKIKFLNPKMFWQSSYVLFLFIICTFMVLYTPNGRANRPSRPKLQSGDLGWRPGRTSKWMKKNKHLSRPNRCWLRIVMLDDIFLSLPKILSNFDKTWITNNPPKNLTALEAQSKVSSDVSSSSTRISLCAGVNTDRNLLK